MTKAQLDALELIGLACIVIGVAVYCGLPLLLIALGAIFVVIGNTGKVSDGISP